MLLYLCVFFCTKDDHNLLYLYENEVLQVYCTYKFTLKDVT